jgi:hypothetical protein
MEATHLSIFLSGVPSPLRILRLPQTVVASQVEQLPWVRAFGNDLDQDEKMAVAASLVIGFSGTPRPDASRKAALLD